MTKPENDAELSQMVVNIQHLAAKLDSVTRERGLRGVEETLADLTAAVRDADWRCQTIRGPWWKRLV